MKPIIGITTFWENRPQKLYNLVSYHYIRSVHMAGGIPILIPLMDDKIAGYEYIKSIDGLILSGGEDISPIVYGENPIEQVKLICDERDGFEINLFLEALKNNLPILGICRGIQIMNVALGGTLYQDIHAQRENTLGHYPKDTPVHNLYHQVHVKNESKIYNVFRQNEIRVNSFHHQAIKEIGNELIETAWAADGIIEAVEHIHKKFVVGVQWHPEDLTVHHPIFLKLFKALIEASKKQKGNFF
ncbi:gamma-glutamyl-gamma-aminobutyrate hydrolase family protein [Crassaminicella thermophila]|uniref:Gamma-glutamyl-gamma-aminobutyrate hydrolase family protein n=1 Tax=Crassaminicella thermophila TaxID=2599308 RepID=A0A5C0SGH1_CRATE|nr:gamma-glutamyl-gamma-aminobutyrate hydrolase family protein [Crassaminicella thermophila]